MGETATWHPGHVVPPPNRGNEVWVGGAVFGGGSYLLGVEDNELDEDLVFNGLITILSGVTH